MSHSDIFFCFLADKKTFGMIFDMKKSQENNNKNIISWQN